MSVQLPAGIKVLNPTPVDALSGPYSSTTVANTSITQALRYIGMDVKVSDPSGKKFWYKNGTTNTDLVEYMPRGIELHNNNTIRIGTQPTTDPSANSILINATTTTFVPDVSGFYVTPIRNVAPAAGATGTNYMYYDPSKNEIRYSSQKVFDNIYTRNFTEQNVLFTGANSSTKYRAPIACITSTNGAIAQSIIFNTKASIDSSGYIWATGLKSLSDINYKSDINKLDKIYCEQLLSQLNPVEYKINNTDDNKHYGLIAQEVGDILQEKTALYYKGYSKDDPDRLEYMELIAPMIKVIQGLLIDKETTNNKLEELQKEINEIKSQLYLR
jgi:hypothetical protein